MPASTVSIEVAIPRTTSTSGIIGTGLKKWRPRNRSGRPVTAAIAVIERLEVFDAKNVAGGHAVSSAVQSRDLTSRSSVTASITSSAGARSSSRVVYRIRPSAASRSAAESFSFSTNLASDRSMVFRPSASWSSWTSRAVTSNPATAAAWAMPLPIWPQPITPTAWIVVIALSAFRSRRRSPCAPRRRSSRGARRLPLPAEARAPA